jgi:hypothetical protein
MFPNVRLVILAVFASIMGISFALGLFAEFRVSHDSVVRESNVSAPLQLGSNDAAPLAVVNTAATFGIRLPATAPPLGTLAVAERGAATEIAKPNTAAPPAAEPVTPPASSASAATAAPLIASAPAPAPPPASSASAAATAPVIASAPAPAPPPASSASAPTVAAVIASAPAPSTPPASPASAPPVAAVIASAPATAAPPASSASAPATAVPIASVSEPAAPASANTSEPGKSVAAPPQHRVAHARRLRKPRSLARRDSLFPSNQPIYQWANQSGLQPPHPVRRRAIIKRVRPAKSNVGEKTAPQATAAAISSPNPPVK